MAKAKKESGAVEVRVLQDCLIGKCGEVVEVDAAELENLKADGLVDDSAEAVEFAKKAK